MHNKVLARGISLALMSSAAGLAQAQQPAQADDASQLEEVIVTAQFRTQNLQETPLAITAVSGDMLERRSQTDISEVARQAPNVTLEDYAAKLAERGGIIEERIVGEEIRSPSVQLRVTPPGDVELLSTHDQLLGGPTGQLYLGCRFPADPAYAALISREARKLGARLARAGVLGRFDFVSIVDAPDNEAAARFSLELGHRAGAHIETMPAVPIGVLGHHEPHHGRPERESIEGSAPA